MRVKRSFVIKVSIIFILIMIGIYAIDYFRENVDIFDTPEEHFPNLHNAERFFFRVGYPEEWDSEAGSYNFFLEDSTGLVLNLFPLVESPDATAIPVTDENATPLPEPLVRDETAILSFYYREIKEDEEIDLSTAMEMAISELLESEKNIKEEDLSSITEVETDNVLLKKVSYTYIPNVFPVKGDMYVAVRKMCYYIIVFEAEHDVLAGSSYNKYKDTVDEIISDFRFSVFDY